MSKKRKARRLLKEIEQKELNKINMKSIFKSKTLGTNLLYLILTIANEKYKFAPSLTVANNAELHASLITGLNMGLRFITKTSITTPKKLKKIKEEETSQLKGK